MKSEDKFKQKVSFFYSYFKILNYFLKIVLSLGMK